ncbi:CHAT domain-containing protein [Fusarium sp. MPI-SDFR-AT-0072]|nr:CHAT domain-containing protein [Fusarium sp. MPI-SDFR-AT-0072]
MERILNSGNTILGTPLLLLALAVFEHRFAVSTRCQPYPEARESARKGLENIRKACQSFQGDLEMEAECRYYWAELILDQTTSDDHFKRLVPEAVEQYTITQDLLDMIQHGIGESPRRFDDWISKRAFRNDGDNERDQRPEATNLAKVGDPEGIRMLEQQDKLAKDLATGKCDGYQSLTEKQMEYNQILSQLEQRTKMKSVLSLRGQYPISKADVDTSVARLADNIVYVDWIHLGRSLLIAVSRPGGCIDYEEIGDFHDLMRNLDECFDEADLRTNSLQRIFGRFENMIKPLESNTESGEVLVLSPTEIMHRLPLHALKVKGEPLIKRNPVVYSCSASLMAICARRRKNSNAYRNGKAVVIANPKNDSTKTKVAASMDESSRVVAKQLQTGTDYISPRRGMRIDDSKKAADGAAILHYHRHVKYNSVSATDTGLVLAGDDILTPKDVANLQLQEGAHVTLIACQSGKQDISLGNEPLGIVPALLVAGACSVLATLWPIPSTAGHKFSESFYRYSLAKEAQGQISGKIDLARAVQKATLDILDIYGENSSNWAPFALQGILEF